MRNAETQAPRHLPIEGRIGKFLAPLETPQLLCLKNLSLIQAFCYLS